MKHTLQAWPAIILAIAFSLSSCSEDTGSLGVRPQEDAVTTSTETFGILSNSIINNNVPANSTACYLGKVIDPETDKAITATFATQFHIFEDYTFPDEDLIVPDGDGHICESIEIRLFIRSVFGDKNNPMKIEVLPLSRNEDKLLKESDKLYTNTELENLYVDDGAEPIATKVFTATDYIMTEAERSSSNYYDNVRIVLDQEFGDYIMRKFYDRDPSKKSPFSDSYSFIREVCAGFLFRPVSGIGTMLNLEVCTMNLHFKYKSTEYPDSTISALCRFAATPEVIQSTQFESSDLSGLVNAMNVGENNTTMLKTPAGICTELILPINKVFKGHETDSISRASLTLVRVNNQDEDAKDDDYALGIPQELLLVRKQNLKNFFEKHQVSDEQQSFTTYFYSTYNSYSFTNISRLLSYCWLEKLDGMKAENKTEEDWERDHPDWNHVVLVPVVVSSATDSYGYTSQVSVNHDLSLGSTKLVRGTEANPIQMQVVYSSFASSK